jgi:hypothetical protein
LTIFCIGLQQTFAAFLSFSYRKWNHFQAMFQAFYLNADPDPGCQTNADPVPDLGQTLKSQKIKFVHKKYT